MTSDAYERLLRLLDQNDATYRVLEHAPEGETEAVSRLRGHALHQAAKCLIVMVKISKKEKRFVLTVIPGDRRVALGAVKELYGGTYAGFASQDIAEELAGSATGTILPFSFDDRLELVVDPALLKEPEFFFNAARLDCSIALHSQDFQRIAQPRIETVSVS